MEKKHIWLRWSGPPLALQIVGLLVSGLVVAQLVTLLLTLLLPPEPQPQYGLNDIAHALVGEKVTVSGGRPLQRVVQAGPPALTGPGWLTSDRSRRDLATLLMRDVADVRLAFYTPLPFAGTTAPPQRQVQIEAPLHQAEAEATRTQEEEYPLPPGFIRAAYQVAQAGPAPGARAFPGGLPGGFPGGAPSGVPSSPPGSFPGAPPPAPPTMGLPPQGAPIGSPSSVPQAPPPAQIFPAPSPGSSNGAPPPGNGMPPSGPGGIAPGAGPGGVPPGGAAPSGPILPPATMTAPPAAVPASPSHPSIVTAPPPGVASEPAPQVTQPPDTPTLLQNETPASPTKPPQAQNTTMPDAAPVPVQAPPRGLFGLAPAPFVEGDFVAALHMADGRWAVVQPVPEAFPNSWQRRVLLWFLFSFALVAPLGWIFARRVVRPIAGFAVAAERLGRDPTAPILALEGPAEVGRAAHAFNRMQSRLRSFVDDRTAFVGAISHDLRTPLTRLRFRIEDVPDELREGMLAEVDEMEQMISSVLSFIRDASEPGSREKLDLRILLEDVVEDAVFVGKDVTMEDSERAPVEVDALGMRRLLSNLVENAVKYGDKAKVRLFTEQQEAVTEIRDEGPGLPEEELERVFQPFYRAPAARASNKHGTGLGLAVCRSIARAHGGDVRLTRGDHGLVAQVRLPLAYGGTA